MTKPVSIRQRALELRKAGFSYSAISEKVKITKGTLSAWLGNVPYVPNKETLLKIGKARTASTLAKHKLKIKSIAEANEQAKMDIGSLNKRDIFMLGVGLYLGEGTKTHNIVRVVNANPQVMSFAVRWFREVCGMKNSNFRLRLHVYPDNNIAESIKFWSNATSVPQSQFQKTSIDTRTGKKMFKRGKLPYGTAHLTIKSEGKKEFGVFLARRINGWISEVLK
ncbi:MAG: helix-turn-helix domain-containing protein [Patescibacteria group bacterium]